MEKSESEYLAKLTPQQKKAVTYNKGPLLIVAGAGTGKTTVLTSRIAWLVEQGIKPDKILALTFTEKAAREMETRIDELLPLGVFGVQVSTFHSFCQKLLQQYPLYSHVSESTSVLSEAEQLLFWRDHIMEFPINTLRPLSHPTTNVEAMMHFISRCKDELISPADLLKWTGTDDLETHDRALYQELANAYQFYQELIRTHNVLDYSELLWRAYQILTDNPVLQKKIQQTYSHILLDEYQDTNIAQIELVKLVATTNHSITAVGDDDQSIYRFRGAAVGQMEQFVQHYKAKIISLKDNFRSTQDILDASYTLIQHNNPHRLEAKLGISKKLKARKALDSKSSYGLRLTAYGFSTDIAEAEWIAQSITEQITAGRSPDDFCILVRTNRQSQLLSRALSDARIPFTSESNLGFAQNPIALLQLNFLKSVANPYDHLALYFLATSLVYNLSGSSITPLLAKSRDLHEPLEQFLVNLADAQSLIQDLQKARDLIPSRSVASMLTIWWKSRPYWKGIMEQDEMEDQRAVLLQFLKLIHQFEHLSSNTDLFTFLEVIPTLLAENNDAPGSEQEIGAVRLYTIHQAKGLEFPVVYITNLSKDRFPTIERQRGFDLPPDLINPLAQTPAFKPGRSQARSEAETVRIYEPDAPALSPGRRFIKNLQPEGEHLREERRLMYVAMTRAGEQLILTGARIYGSGKPKGASPFLHETGLTQEIVLEATLKPKEQTSDTKVVPVMNHTPKTIFLSPHSLDDYLQCPLRYKYRHLDHAPTPYDQNMMVGQCMHKAIEHYFAKRKTATLVTSNNLEAVIESCWSNRGFISKEHIPLRKKDVMRQLFTFVQRFNDLPSPTSVEQPFAVRFGDATLRGRIDSVFAANLPGSPEGASTVIVDFKTTDRVTSQEQADKKAGESLQLRLYALAWQEQYGKAPDAVGLYFTSSDLFGWAIPTKRKIDNSREKITEVVQKIQAAQFAPTPDPFTCGQCDFKSFCPFSQARD